MKMIGFQIYKEHPQTNKSSIILWKMNKEYGYQKVIPKWILNSHKSNKLKIIIDFLDGAGATKLRFTSHIWSATCFWKWRSVRTYPFFFNHLWLLSHYQWQIWTAGTETLWPASLKYLQKMCWLGIDTNHMFPNTLYWQEWPRCTFIGCG